MMITSAINFNSFDTFSWLNTLFASFLKLNALKIKLVPGHSFLFYIIPYLLQAITILQTCNKYLLVRYQHIINAVNFVLHIV